MLLCAVLFLASCAFIEPTSQSEVGLNWLQDPNVRNGILHALLESRGTSANEIQDIINSSNGDVNRAVTGINSAINENLLRVDGDAVRVDPNALRNTVKSALQSTIRQKFPQSPNVVSLLEDTVNRQIDSESPHFDAAVARSAVSLEVARRSLRTRALQPRFDLLTLILNALESLLGPLLSNLLSLVLLGIQNVLLNVVINGPLPDPFIQFLADIFNFVVNLLANAVGLVRQSLTCDATAASSLALSAQGDLDGLAEGIQGGLLDGILAPVLSLIGHLTTPINEVLKVGVQAVLNFLQPVLGSILVTNLGNVAIALIDLLIPANPL